MPESRDAALRSAHRRASCLVSMTVFDQCPGKLFPKVSNDCHSAVLPHAFFKFDKLSSILYTFTAGLSCKREGEFIKRNKMNTV